ncbi:MAG TPA: 50S ribosomal protein L23 [Candidatus Moranbacteria bacterium]|nr:50S ribosomal protein L23 [Candidatus Moranbacteria bacterium]
MENKILVEPWITEAATAAGELGKYIFKVEKYSTKIQIKKAVEDLYKVKVVSVRTINLPSKKRTRGRIVGRKPGLRKAIVTVKKGESIDVFGNK